MTETNPQPDEQALYDDMDYADLDLERAEDVHVVRRPGPRSTFAIRLDGKTIQELRDVAGRYGTRPTQIAREWLVERLGEERRRGMGPERPSDVRRLEDRVAGLETRLAHYLEVGYAPGIPRSSAHDVDVIAGFDAQALFARELVQRLATFVSVEVPADPGADLIVRRGDRSWVFQFKSGAVDLAPSFKHLVTLAKRLKARPVLVTPQPASPEIEAMALSSDVLVTTPNDLDDLVSEITSHVVVGTTSTRRRGAMSSRAEKT